MSRTDVRPGLALFAMALVWAGAADRGVAQRPPPGSPVADWRATSTETPAISGTVVDATTGRPLAGAVVALLHGSAGTVGAQSTDGAGRFLFSNLPMPDPAYYLRAASPGYLDGAFADAPLAPPHPVTFAAESDWLKDIEIRLAREGATGGRVLNHRGEPLAGVRVVALHQMGIAGELRFITGTSVTTDDRGAYRIAALLPGTYTVMVPSVRTSVPAEAPSSFRSLLTIDQLAPPGAAARALVTEHEALVTGSMHLLLDEGQPPRLPPTPDGRRQGYATTFHRGVRAMDAAEAIALAPGDERSGIDIRLEAIPLFSVTGSLTGPPGAVGHVRLFLMPRGTEVLGLGHEAATTVSAVNGRFAFPEVPVGEYTLLAGMRAAAYVHPLRGASLHDVTGPNARSMPMGDPTVPILVSRARDNSAYTARLDVRVTAADVAGLVVPLQRGVTIRGRLVQGAVSLSIRAGALLGPSSTAEDQAVRAEPAGAEPMLGLSRVAVGMDALSEDFAIENVVPGDYVLRAPGVVRSVQWNGRDYTNVPLPVRPGSDVSGVVITTTPFADRTFAHGVVRNAHGEPAWNATVLGFPDDPARWRRHGLVSPGLITSRPMLGDRAGNATFMFSVPVGDYYLVATTDPLPDTWREASFLERAARVATRISVVWGETTRQDLTTVPLGR